MWPCALCVTISTGKSSGRDCCSVLFAGGPFGFAAAEAGMYWAIFAFLTFCFGVGMWEFLVIEQSKKLRGNDYRSNLPRSFSSPVFKLLTLAGHSGIIIVPLIGW